MKLERTFHCAGIGGGAGTSLSFCGATAPAVSNCTAPGSGPRTGAYEVQLQPERQPLRIPVRKELALVLVNLSVGHLERHGLVWLRREQQVLPRLVRRLDALLVRRHEAVPRLQPLLDLGVVDLEEQAALLRLRIHLLDDLVPRPADLDGLPRLDAVLADHHVRRRRVALLARRAPRQVLLVALALRVREVVALVVVQREAQLALERAQVVATTPSGSCHA